MCASLKKGSSSHRGNHTYLIALVALMLCSAFAVGKAKRAHMRRSSSDLKYIKGYCNATMYPRLCVASLYPYDGLRKGNHTRLVSVGVEVSLAKNQKASAFLANLAKQKVVSEGDSARLEDCVDIIGDAVDWIQQSLAELQNLRPYMFEFQMTNVQNWLSAAIADQENCSNGFDVADGRVKEQVARWMHSVSKYTSNALYLVRDYAVNGGD